MMTEMRESRLICDKEMEIQQQRLDSYHLDFQKYLQSLFSKSQQSLEAQENLRKLKVELREADAELVKSLAAITKKEAERMAILDSVSATNARIEELKALFDDQTNRKDEYSEMVSQQSRDLLELQEMRNQSSDQHKDIEEAISWYNKVLGLQIECGHGVKFIFTNIDCKDPNLQYSFTIRFADDVYSLLYCNPPLSHTNELLVDLNRTNELFKFVRTVREKFQEAMSNGNIPQVLVDDQETSLISLSAPVSSVSTDCRNESALVVKEVQPVGTNRRKANTNRGGTQAIKSPGSASSLRRTPRVKGKK